MADHSTVLANMKREAIRLHRSGSLVESMRILEEICEQDSGDSEAICLLGVICAKLDYLGRSARLLARAVKIAPDNNDSRYNLALILHRLGELGPAAAQLQHVIDNDSKYLNAYLVLGNIQLVSGEFEKAAESFRTVRQHDPENLEAVAREAEVYERQGETEQAYNMIKPYITDDLDNPFIAYIYARLALRFDNCQKVIGRLEAVLKEGHAAGRMRATLNFSLGDLYDKTCRYDEAFYHYREGNRLVRNPSGIRMHRKHTDQVIATFSKDNLANMPRSDCSSELPVFVVGMPRSGTSLVENILASHNDIYGAGELKTLDRIVRNLEKQVCQGLPGNGGNKAIIREWMNPSAKIYIDELQGISPSSLRVVDKMPANYQLLGYIALLFPNARVVHCKRNAIDTCLSCFFKNFSSGHFYSNSLEDIGQYYLSYRNMMNHWMDVLDIPIYEISYENLVEDPDGEIRSLVDYCGVEWNSQCLRFSDNARVVNTASYIQARKPIYRESLGRWRNYETHIGRLLEILGEYR